LALAQEARRRALPLSLVAIRKLTLPAVAQLGTAWQWLPLGQLEAAVRFLRATGARRVLFAGAVPAWHQLLRVRPDRLAVELLWQRPWLGDDGFLRTLAERMTHFGLEVIPPGSLAAALLAPEGRLAGPPLTAGQQALAQRAWHVARQTGRQDRGQSAVVAPGGVLREDRWGTDHLLRQLRARRWREAVMVKVAKPQQDRRFDLPTIGPSTVGAALRAGVRTLVVEAEATVVVDQQETFRLAQDSGLSLYAWPRGGFSTKETTMGTLEHQIR
jgi:DUF1009 family protein